jgi:ureidoglycolate hydrolase
VIAEPLTADSFDAFGHVLAQPSGAPDATGEGWSWWAQAGRLPADERSYAIGYLALEPAEPEFDWCERHPRAAELIVPIGGDCVVYAAPAAEQPAGFRAFRVTVGTGVVLDPGVWHGAPLAVDRALSAVVVLPQGTGTEDTTVVRFPENPIRIEV